MKRKIYPIRLLFFLVSVLHAQNVGIGTALPASKLSVTGNLSIGSSYAGVSAPANGAIIEGNVGIGTANPLARLHVTGVPVGAIHTPGFPGDVLLVEGNHGCVQLAGSGRGTGAAHLIITNTDNGNRHWTINHMATGGWQNKFTIGYLETSGAGWFPWASKMFVTIDTTGNVGIGTTMPDNKLEVNGAIEIQVDNADNKLRFHDPGDYWYSMGIDRSDGGKFKINYGGNIGDNTHFVMTTNGNVGIGTTAPTYQLQLSLNSAAKPGSNTWTVISDERLKRITGKYQKGLKEILQLEPITYYYVNNKDSLFDPRVLEKENIGFTAQAVAKIFPEAVDTASNGYLGLNIHPILIAYVNAIKELNNVTKLLNEKDKELMSKTQELEAKVKEIAQLKAEIGRLNSEMKAKDKEIENLKSEIKDIKILFGLQAEK